MIKNGTVLSRYQTRRSSIAEYASKEIAKHVKYSFGNLLVFYLKQKTKIQEFKNIKGKSANERYN